MIIFDYGRTLYDRETDDFFPDAIPVVKTLAEKYRLSIVSVSPADEEETRIEALREQGILDHFEEIVFTASGDAKSKEYEDLLRKADLKANEVVVVDDYITDVTQFSRKSSTSPQYLGSIGFNRSQDSEPLRNVST